MPILGSIASGVSGNLYTTLLAFDSIASSSPTGTSVTFSSIPQTYTHLKVIATAQSDYTAYNLDDKLIFNGDTSNAYLSTNMQNAQGTFYGYRPNPNMNVTRGSVNGTYMTSGWSVGEIDIFNYTATDIYKSVQGQWSTTALSYPAVYQNVASGVWQSTAAINSLTFTLSTGSHVAGSEFTLFGLL